MKGLTTPKINTNELGDGKYQLIDVNTDGVTLPLALLSNENRKKALESPRGDVSYVTSAYLTRTNDELNTLRNEFKRTYHNLKRRITPDEHYSVNLVDIEGSQAYYIGLNAAFEEQKWYALNAENTQVALLYIDKNHVTVLTDHPVTIGVSSKLASLSVHSTHHVWIESSLKLREQLEINAYSVHFAKGDRRHIDVKSLCIRALQTVNLHGRIRAESVAIKSGQLNNFAKIETKDNVTVIAQQVKHEGQLRSKGDITAIAQYWLNSPGSEIHTPKMYKSIIKESENKGHISCNDLIMLSRHAKFEGDTYVGMRSYIAADRSLHSTQSARFILNNKAYQSGAWIHKFDGKLVFDPDLRVSWKQIIDPTRFISKEEHIMLSIGMYDNELIERYTSNKKEVAYIPSALVKNSNYLSNKYLALTEDYQSTIEESSTFESRVVCLHSNDYLEITGELIIKDGHLLLNTGGLLEYTGGIWQTSFFGEFEMLITANEARKSGSTQTDAKTRVQVKETYIESGEFKSTNTLNIEANDFIVKKGASIKVETANVKTENTIKTEKQSELVSKTQVVLKSKDIIHKGKIESSSIHAKADRLIYLRGEVKSEIQGYHAPLYLSIGRRSGQTISITAGLSLTLGHIHAGQYINNSIVNVSLALVTPKGLKNTSPSMLAFSGFNSMSNVASIVAPKANIIVRPLQIIVNAGMRGYMSYQLSKHLFSENKLDWLTAASMVSQLAVSGTLLWGSGKSAYQLGNQISSKGLSSLVPKPANWTQSLTNIAANSAGILSGNYNTALVNIDFGASATMGTTEYHLLSVSAGPRAMLTHNNTSVMNVDGNYEYTAANNVSCGMNLVSIGEHHALIGQQVANYHRVDVVSLPGVNHTYNAWSIHSDEIHTHGDICFVNSTVKSHTLIDSEGNTLKFDHSNVIIEDVTQEGDLQATNSTFVIEHAYTGDEAQSVYAHSAVQIHELDNHGQTQFAVSHVDLTTEHNAAHAKLLITGSQFKADSIDNQEGAIINTHVSEVEINSLNNHGEFLSEDSVIHIHDYKISEGSNTHLDHTVMTVDHVAGNGKIRLVHALLNLTDANQHARELTLEGHDAIVYEGNPETNIVRHELYQSHPNDEETINVQTAQPLPVNLDEVSKLPDLVAPRFKAAYVDGTIVFLSENDVLMRDQSINSLLPVAYSAPNIQLQGALQGDAHVIFTTAHDLSLMQATLDYSHGVEFLAEDYFRSVASQVRSPEAIFVSGNKGVITDASAQVQSNTHRHFGLSGYKKTTTTTTTITPSVFDSTNGKVSFISSTGDVTLKATYGHGKAGVDIYGNNGIKLYDVRGINSVENTHLGWSSYSKNNASDVISAPTILDSESPIRMYADEGDIDGVGVFINSDQLIYAHADHMMFERPVLDHYVSYSYLGIELKDISGIPVATHSQDWMQSFNHEPLYTDVNQILHANSTADLIAGFWNTGIDSVNAVNHVLSGLRNNNLGKEITSRYQLGDSGSFYPVFHFQVGYGKGRYHSQTLGVGMMRAPSVILDAKTIDFKNAFGLQAKVATIHAHKVELNGATLHSSAHTRAYTGDIYMTATGDIQGVGGSMNAMDTHSTTHELMQFKVDHLNLDVDDLSVRSAVIDAKTLSGRVGQLDVVSEQDSRVTKEFSLSGSTQGQVSQSSYLSLSRMLNQTSGISGDGSELSVGRASLTAGNLSQSIQANELSKESVIDVSKSWGYSISTQLTPQTTESLDEGLAHNVFDTTTLGVQWSNYRAENDGVNIPHVMLDDHIGFSVKIPSVNAQGAREFSDNTQWFADTYLHPVNDNSILPFPGRYPFGPGPMLIPDYSPDLSPDAVREYYEKYWHEDDEPSIKYPGPVLWAAETINAFGDNFAQTIIEDVTNVATHPIVSAKEFVMDTTLFTWDMLGATSNALGIGETEAQRVRNTARWSALTEGVNEFNEADAVGKAVSLGKLTAGLVEGVVIGGAAVKVGRLGRYGLFTPVDLEESILIRGPVTADRANAYYVGKGYTPPYAVGSRARDLVLDKDRWFVRIHGADNQSGSWLVRPSEIEGMNAGQIQQHLALPNKPVFVSDVLVPKGTNIRVGRIAEQHEWSVSGGGRQYELLHHHNEKHFLNSREIGHEITVSNQGNRVGIGR